MERTLKLGTLMLFLGIALCLPKVASAQCFATPCSGSTPSSSPGDYLIQGLYLNASQAELPGGPTAPSQTFYVRLVANRGTGTRGIDSLSFLLFYNPTLAEEPIFGKERTAENGFGGATIGVSTNPILEGQNPSGLVDPRFTDNDPQTTHYKVITAAYDTCYPLLPNHPLIGGPILTDPIMRIKFVTSAGFAPPLVMGLKDNPDSSRPLQETCDEGARRAPYQSNPAQHTFNNTQLLAVDMMSFKAVATGVGDPINVTWDTAAEIDNIGFNLYRATVDGPAFSLGEQLNTSMIPAAGDATSGASYSFLDDKPLAAGEVRSYVLEDVDLNGISTMHGPVSTEAFGAGSDVTGVDDWQMYDF
ncbi:hypothetical protein KQI84_00825 [bacterium]|nr:hypothetical protein [bacterium]